MSSSETQDVWLPHLFRVKQTPSKKQWNVSKPSWVKPGLFVKIAHERGYLEELGLVIEFRMIRQYSDIVYYSAESAARSAYVVIVLHNGLIKTYPASLLFLHDVPVQRIPVKGTMNTHTKRK
jgi:hypothetical protein